MEGYKKWVDGLGKGLRIVFAIFVSLIYFLYRLFNVIEEKAQNKDHLIYLILNVVPFVAIVVWVLDLVAAVKGAPVPLAFGKKDKKEQRSGHFFMSAPECFGFVFVFFLY